MEFFSVLPPPSYHDWDFLSQANNCFDIVSIDSLKTTNLSTAMIWRSFDNLNNTLIPSNVALVSIRDSFLCNKVLVL